MTTVYLVMHINIMSVWFRLPIASGQYLTTCYACLSEMNVHNKFLNNLGTSAFLNTSYMGMVESFGDVVKQFYTTGLFLYPLKT